MTWFGTDVMALGCIAGSALVGGAATAAALHRGHDARVDCALEASALAPRIAIAHGGRAHTVVVAPTARVRYHRNCADAMDGAVEVHVGNHLVDLDAQLEKLDQALEIQMDGLESQIEAQIEAQLKAQGEQQVGAEAQLREAVRQMERAQARVKVVVGRAGGGV